MNEIQFENSVELQDAILIYGCSSLRYSHFLRNMIKER